MGVTSSSTSVTGRTLIYSGTADQNLSANIVISTSAAAVLGGPKQQVFPLTSSLPVTLFDVWLGDDIYVDATYNADGVADVDTITVDATGGYWQITTRSGTASAYSTLLSAVATGAAVQTAIRLHPGYAAATVTGGPGDSGGTTPYVLTCKPTVIGDKGTVTVRNGRPDGTDILTGGAGTVALVHTTAGADPTRATTPTVTVLATGAVTGY